MKDIAQEVSSHLERIDFDPAEMDAVTNRLDKLYSLEKKYHVDTVEELMTRRDELGKQLNNIENSDEALADLQQQVKQLEAKLAQQEHDYQSLKMARMMEITDGDLEGAKERVAKMIRDVNKCIAVLSDEK